MLRYTGRCLPAVKRYDALSAVLGVSSRLAEKFALIEYRLAKSGEMVVISVLPVAPAGTAVNTFGKDGAKLVAGKADTVKNAGFPLPEIARRYWSVCGES